MKKAENKKGPNKEKDRDTALAEKVGISVGKFWSFFPFLPSAFALSSS